VQLELYSGGMTCEDGVETEEVVVGGLLIRVIRGARVMWRGRRDCGDKVKSCRVSNNTSQTEIPSHVSQSDQTSYEEEKCW
jgi:hypothetical protein